MGRNDVIGPNLWGIKLDAYFSMQVPSFCGSVPDGQFVGFIDSVFCIIDGVSFIIIVSPFVIMLSPDFIILAPVAEE